MDKHILEVAGVGVVVVEDFSFFVCVVECHSIAPFLTTTRVKINLLWNNKVLLIEKSFF